MFLICFEIHLSLDVSFCTSIEGEKKHVCIEPQSITLLYQKQELLTLHEYMGSPSFSLGVFTNTWVHHRSAWWCSRVHGFTLVQLGGVHEYMGSPSFSLVVFTSTWVHPRSAWWCSRVHGFTLVQLGGVHEYMGSPSFSLVVFVLLSFAFCVVFLLCMSLVCPFGVL